MTTASTIDRKRIAYESSGYLIEKIGTDELEEVESKDESLPPLISGRTSPHT
jgi:hypothetical protein